MHLSKFHLGLAPATRGRPVQLMKHGWSGNLLIDRATFYAFGGWPWTSFQGDAVFTADLARAGLPLWLAPDAAVEHDHEQVTLRAFLRERFVRGKEFAHLEVAGAVGDAPWSRARLQRQVVATPLLPVKIALATARIVRDAQAAGHGRKALLTLPVIAAGRAAWLSGRALGMLAIWRRARSRTPAPPPRSSPSPLQHR